MVLLEYFHFLFFVYNSLLIYIEEVRTSPYLTPYGDNKMGKPIKYRILAFDPGISNTGWSLLEGNTGDNKLVVLKLGEFHPGPVAERAANRQLVEKFDKRTISLSLLTQEMSKLLEELKPEFVCCEDIFINMFHPTAITPLAMWQAAARLCVMQYGKKLIVIPTKVCKKALTGSGSNGKLSVQAAVVTNENISFKSEYDKMHMTEHMADSIAVAVAMNSLYRDFIFAILGLL